MPPAPVYILAAARTPIGAFGGAFRDIPVTKLASAAIQAAMDRAAIHPEEPEEILMGCALQAGVGPNMARQAGLLAGVTPHAPGTTFSLLAGSSLQAIAQAARTIQAGEIHLAIAGGAENASRAPYLLPAARWGHHLGATDLLDAMLLDGHWSKDDNTPRNPVSESASGLAQPQSFEHQSLRLALAAHQAGCFRREMVPIPILRGKHPGIQDQDELLEASPAGVPLQAPAPWAQDGAAALVLASEQKATRPMARILGFTQAAAAPSAPPHLGTEMAIRKLLAKTGLRLEEMAAIELDESSPTSPLALLQKWPGQDPTRVNRRGGACALGCPLGAAGARILTTLLHILQDEGGRYGLAALSAGGGQGLAMLLERLP